MRVISRQMLRRWAVVAAGTALLCALPAVVGAFPTPASRISAAQLRARIAASAHESFQGYAESYTDLGVPSLPDLGNVVSLMDGTTAEYVWYAAPDRWRADQLTSAGENDLYQTPRGTYVWNYTTNALTRVTGSQPVRLPRASDLLPPELALRLVGLAGRATRVSRLPGRRVAGIDAAGLRLVPEDTGSTISAVDIWADPANGVAVEVDIYAQGYAAPVLVSHFLSVSLARPAAGTLQPRPGPGIDVSTTTLPDASRVLNGYGPVLPASLGLIRRVASPPGLQDVAAYGAGFARFAVVPLPARLGNEVLTAASAAGVAVDIAHDTAVVVRTPLITVLLVRSPAGPVYLLAGAVTAPRLVYAATRLMDSS